MSRKTEDPNAYRLVFAPEVRQQWQQLPQRNRASMERTLTQLAWAVGQRQWVGEQEADEQFCLFSGPYELNYYLEPSKRTLVVRGVKKYASETP